MVMDSLATVLRRIPLFADLPPGSFAKIIADLREERHPPGTVICYEGEEAHDFYIIKSGQVEVLVNRGGNQRELVALIGERDRIRLTTANVPAKLRQALEEIDGIEDVAIVDDTVDVYVRGASRLLARVLDRAEASGAVVTGVEIAVPDLEAVFLRLTGKALRD